MDNKKQYIDLATEIIKKQSIILGPDIAMLKAKNISEITLTPEGIVTSISGNADQVIQKLVDEYVALSGEIVKSALSSVFTKYPDIKKVE